MRKSYWLLLLFFFVGCAAAQQPSSPREQLNQYVADLQKNPSDDALREKIIKLAQELKPPPAVAEEARRHFVKAETLAHDAQSPEDAAPAIEEYKKATAIAPWWGEPYRGIVIMLEAAQRFDEAKKNLDFFLMTNPPEADARAAQDEKYKIEAKEEKAIEEQRKRRERAEEERKQAEIRRQEEDERLARRLVGAWRQRLEDAVPCYSVYELAVTGSTEFTLTLVGNQGCVASPFPGQTDVTQASVSGLQISGRRVYKLNYSPWGCGWIRITSPVEGAISEDGSVIQVVEKRLPNFNLGSCGFEGTAQKTTRLERR